MQGQVVHVPRHIVKHGSNELVHQLLVLTGKKIRGCQTVNPDLKREPSWECLNCGADHDRNENAARNLLKLALLAVGENVMLPDGEALAGGHSTNGETAPASAVLGDSGTSCSVAPARRLSAGSGTA